MKCKATFRLPFRLAVISGTGVGSGRGDMHFQVFFEQKDLMITGDQWEDEPFPITIVTIEALLPDEENMLLPLAEEAVARIFGRLLWYLNRVVDSYRIASQDYTVYNVLTGDLPSRVSVWVNETRYTLNIRNPYSNNLPPDVNERDVLSGIGTILASWDTWPERLTIERFYVEARRSFERGDAVQAIVSLETAFELKVVFALKMLMRQAGVPDPQQQNVLMCGLKNIIQTHLKKYLGGEFSYNQPGPIKLWKNKLYDLRNDCVHEGKLNISPQQVTEAFDAFHQVDNYLGEKLMAKGILSSDATFERSAFTSETRVESDDETITAHLRAIGVVDEQGKIQRL